MDVERVAKNLLESNKALSNQNKELSESGEIERLNDELNKIQNRFGEQLNLEEKRRLESIEQYQVS